jgi:hypothetical protein
MQRNPEFLANKEDAPFHQEEIKSKLLTLF